MERKKFTPIPGETYKNRGGGKYRCLRSGSIYGARSAVMQHVATRWTFVAVGCTLYQDGSIEWARSAYGTFAYTDEDTKAFIMDRYADALCGIGTKLKEKILAEADEDPMITALDLRRLVDIAYSESL